MYQTKLSQFFEYINVSTAWSSVEPVLSSRTSMVSFVADNSVSVAYQRLEILCQDSVVFLQSYSSCIERLLFTLCDFCGLLSSRLFSKHKFCNVIYRLVVFLERLDVDVIRASHVAIW